MDPVAIGVAVGMTVVSRLTKSLMEKAVDPTRVAKSVNWLFGAVSHFLKLRRKEESKDTPIPAPPEVTPEEEPPQDVSDEAVEEQTAAVEKISKSLGEKMAPEPGGEVRLVEIDDFTMEQIEAEIDSLLKQLSTYLGNLRFEEEKAAQYGGPAFVPVILMNTIRLQRVEISSRLVRLNESIERAYGVAAPNLDVLASAAKQGP